MILHIGEIHFCITLGTKSGKEVASALEILVFPFIGLPSITQGDNGREFVNMLIEVVVASWPESVQLVSGQSRHPQSQGLVEQAHYILE